jgi:UDP-N-acetylmuramate--alanine ligase
MDLTNFHQLHFIGIGGMGMRALAQVMLSRGIGVSGSDLSDSPALEQFRREGARIYIGHRPGQADHAEGVVISSAISADNPELQDAREKGIPVFHRSDLLAAVIAGGRGVAVAGAHGKSTTSAMIGLIFEKAGTDPTIVLGGSASYLQGNSRLGRGSYVIAEADESDATFLKFFPYVAVVTNIEDDHLDHYGTVENIKKAFAEFISHVPDEGGAAVVCTDSEGVRDILPRIHKKCITFGLSPEAEYRACRKHYEGRKMVFEAWHRDHLLGTLALQIPGDHNMRDAMGAAAAALYCGIPFETVRAALGEFQGVRRRFETKAHIGGIWVVDDYAHHPTEIEATLRAAREIGNYRIVCAFQPHRYSRTRLLQKEFVDAFGAADVLYMTDIYGAGESPEAGVDGTLLPRLIREKHPHMDIRYEASPEKLARSIAEELRPGDLFLTMGAGNIYETGHRVIRILEEKGLKHDQ